MEQELNPDDELVVTMLGAGQEVGKIKLLKFLKLLNFKGRSILSLDRIQGQKNSTRYWHSSGHSRSQWFTLCRLYRSGED